MNEVFDWTQMTPEQQGVYKEFLTFALELCKRHGCVMNGLAFFTNQPPHGSGDAGRKEIIEELNRFSNDRGIVFLGSALTVSGVDNMADHEVVRVCWVNDLWWIPLQNAFARMDDWMTRFTLDTMREFGDEIGIDPNRSSYNPDEVVRLANHVKSDDAYSGMSIEKRMVAQRARAIINLSEFMWAST